jgi:uncharacterized membrane protein YgcG
MVFGIGILVSHFFSHNPFEVLHSGLLRIESILAARPNRSPDRRQKENVMTNTAPRNLITIVLWSTAWALALIASAILLKGNPTKEWVQAVLFIGALTVSLWQGQRLTCRR